MVGHQGSKVALIGTLKVPPDGSVANGETKRIYSSSNTCEYDTGATAAVWSLKYPTARGAV